MIKLSGVLALIGVGIAGAVDAGQAGRGSSLSGKDAVETVTIRQAVYRVSGDPATRVWAARVSMRSAIPQADNVGVASITEVLQTEERLAMLNALIRSSGLSWPHSDRGGLTLFAPTNEALNALPSSVLSRLARDPIALDAFLQRHSIAGVLERPRLQARAGVLSLAHRPLEIGSGADLTINGATLLKTSLVTRDGVIHFVDRALTK